VEGDKDIRVEYYLIEDGENQFGIKAKTKDDVCTVCGITSSRGEALALIRILKQNYVTPVTLKDVILDWIVEKSSYVG